MGLGPDPGLVLAGRQGQGHATVAERLVPVAGNEEHLAELQMSPGQLGGRTTVTKRLDRGGEIGDGGLDVLGVEVQRAPQHEQVAVLDGHLLGTLREPASE